MNKENVLELVRKFYEGETNVSLNQEEIITDIKWFLDKGTRFIVNLSNWNIGKGFIECLLYIENEEKYGQEFYLCRTN